MTENPERIAEELDRPWETLEAMFQQAEPPDEAAVEAFLQQLPASEAVRAVSRLADDDQARLLGCLSPGEAADLLAQLPEPEAVHAIEQLAPEAAATIVGQLPSNEQADLISHLDQRDAEAILVAMPAERASNVRRLAEYPEDRAGGLMVTEFVAYPLQTTAAEVIADLRAQVDRYRKYDVQYAFVTDDEARLVGVLRLRDLLLAEADQTVTEMMIRDPFAVRDDAALDQLREFFDEHDFLGVPVVTADSGLVGVVRRADVEEALRDRDASDFRKTQGILQEELRTMPVRLRSQRRLAWLSINILLNVVAASVIAFHQETLQQVIALAVFLPIISDMSGCSGNQAVAVSMRELALGVTRPNELLRVWGKELSVGAINGLALGVMIGGVAWLWKGNPMLGVVVGVSLCLNTVLACSLGGLLPLLMRRMNRDPALASGPILTTITDMCGFFVVLTLAALFLRYLV